MEAEMEEREKKAIAEKKIEKERRREERENFEMCNHEFIKVWLSNGNITSLRVIIPLLVHIFLN